MTKKECYQKVDKEWKGGIYPGMAWDKMMLAMHEYAKYIALEFYFAEESVPPKLMKRKFDKFLVELHKSQTTP
jgi:hypothetical protein